MAGATLTLCETCLFWEHHGASVGLCRRHAPAASSRAYEVARWPETRSIDGCGQGQALDRRADDAGKGQTCGNCLYWNRPGEGISPALRGDHLAAWWDEAGYCRRFAPYPGTDFGAHAFWRATHASDHCFDGSPTGPGPQARPEPPGGEPPAPLP